MNYPYTPEGRQGWLEEHITDMMNEFFKVYGETIGDYDELQGLVDSALKHWAVAFGDFYEMSEDNYDDVDDWDDDTEDEFGIRVYSVDMYDEITDKLNRGCYTAYCTSYFDITGPEEELSNVKDLLDSFGADYREL